MAFKIKRESAVTLIADERIYLTADQTEAVHEGDPRAAILLAGKGQPIHGRFVKLLEPKAEPKVEEPKAAGVEPEKRKDRALRATTVR